MGAHLIAATLVATTTATIASATLTVEVAALLAVALLTVALTELAALLTVSLLTIALTLARTAIVAALVAPVTSCSGVVEGALVFGQFEFPLGQRFAIGADDHTRLGRCGLFSGLRCGLGRSVVASGRLGHGLGRCGLFEDLVDQLGLLRSRHGLHAECLGDCHQLLAVLALEYRLF